MTNRWNCRHCGSGVTRATSPNCAQCGKPRSSATTVPTPSGDVAIDYSIIHEYAIQMRVSYISLCIMVRRSIGASK